MIDLRSDTVTTPTAAMRQAMAQAAVGDDVFGEDPTVIELEQRMAAMFGHEAAVYCSSGTMTNQIAICTHTRPGDEVICEEGAHVYRYEGGGMMANSGCSVKFIAHDHGRFTAADVQAAISDRDNVHLARTRMVCVENTSNRGGGSVWNLDEVKRIRKVCDEQGLALHLDGARIFNAMAIDGTRPSDWGAPFDSISICLSKGLGAPVGSVLVGNKAFIHEARRVRKRFGGGMRQVGIIAAAGLHALDHHVTRLADDHARAERLEQALRGRAFVASMMPVQTNIVVFTVKGMDVADLLSRFRKENIAAVQFGPGMVRMVTHLDISDADIDKVIAAIDRIAS